MEKREEMDETTQKEKNGEKKEMEKRKWTGENGSWKD